MVQSKTGSGKTASYGIPVCEQIDWEENKPQALDFNSYSRISRSSSGRTDAYWTL